MAKEFICRSDYPVVETKAGKVRGFVTDGTFTFWGIPYATAQRWENPVDVAPWEGVKDALSYGYVSPMLDKETNNGEIMCPHRYWVKDENCQNLNVWTQSIEAGVKKPVLVWFHGGGFSAGSSIEQVAYDGENLSKFGDVVVVTVNHRLNILGYLDLSAFSEKFWNSANVGNADLVASLKWVHENIANFGGDPENVTIFGQSGGGAKVQSMMQISEAAGLFHKAAIMSGVANIDMMYRIDHAPKTKELGEAIYAELGIDPKTDPEAIAEVPYEKLAEAYRKAAAPFRAEREYTGSAPVANSYYLGDPRVAGFGEHAKSIPTMVGCCIAEMAFGSPVEKKHELSEEAQVEILKEFFGDDTPKFVELFKEAYPEKLPIDMLSIDTWVRPEDKDFVKKKAAVSTAPTYDYVFNYEFPIDDGKLAWHCADLGFWFHNQDKVVVGNKPGISDQLEANMAGALVNFAKTGVPSAPGLPEWTPSTTEDIYTMVFDDECKLVKNFDDKFLPAYLPVKPDPRKFNKKNIALH